MKEVTHFKKAIIVSVGIILAMIIGAIWAHVQVEEGAKVPIHWNAKGEVDGWAGKGGLWIVPAATILQLLAFALVPLFEPRLGKKLRDSKAYCAVIVGAAVVMLCAQAGIVATAQGMNFPMTPVIATAVGGLFIVIGNYLGKIRSNYVMGIRTPWTLSSELSWNKTHRLGGKLFALTGLGFLIGGWIPGGEKYLIWVILGGVGILVGVTTVYSWMVWKNDPNKSEGVNL